MKYYEIMKEMVRSAQWGAVTRLILRTLLLGFLLTYSLGNIWITASEHWYQVGAMLRIGVLAICVIVLVNVMVHYWKIAIGELMVYHSLMNLMKALPEEAINKFWEILLTKSKQSTEQEQLNQKS